MRVLVCGGRDYDDADAVAWDLNRYAVMHDGLIIVCGYDPDDDRYQGVDQLAYEWARAHRIPVAPFPAPWLKRGRAAGPIRNQRMLDCMQPEKVLAFPGGRGTADMMRWAKKAGIPVVQPNPASAGGLA